VKIGLEIASPQLQGNQKEKATERSAGE